MKIVNADVALRIVEPIDSDKETLCEVVIKQTMTGIFIRGKVMEEAVYISEGRYLIFTTDDVIFEETLNIYLIELGKGVLDKLWIGQPYNTDIFSGVTMIDQQTLSFNFLYLKDWKLSVYPQARLRRSITSWLFFFQGFRLFRYLTLGFMPQKKS